MHHPNINCFPIAASLSSLGGPNILNSVHSHNYELTNEYSPSSHHASLPNYYLQIDRLQVLLETRSMMASKCISKLTRSRPPGVSPDLLDCSLQVPPHTHSITASKCTSRLAWLRPASASPNSLDPGLQMVLRTRSITACKFAWS